MGLLVQFGCGLCAPEEWANFDSSPSLRLQKIPVAGRFAVSKYGAFPHNVRYGDITRGLPLPEKSCEVIYSSHVLEHLALTDLRAALKEVNRLLKPGGRFRFVMPDLEHLARTYLATEGPDACSKFMRDSYLGQENRRRGVVELARGWLGNSQHLWMWDYKGMAEELALNGFVSIRRAGFGDSGIDALALVETHDRWHNALGIDCFSANVC